MAKVFEHYIFFIKIIFVTNKYVNNKLKKNKNKQLQCEFVRMSQTFVSMIKWNISLNELIMFNMK